MRAGSPLDRGGHVVWAAILLFATLLTIKYFPGLENEQAYAGNVFQILHPGAFAGDLYRDPSLPTGSRPLQLTLFYVIARLAGDLMLDDRFLAVLYIGLVAISLVGIDRTARVLGVTGTLARLVILLFFLKDHAVLDHKVLLAHHQGVNHTVLAIPLIVWLFYAAIARKGLVVVLVLSALLAAASFRNAPFPVVMALAVVAFTGKPWERAVSWAGLVLGSIACLVFLASHWVDASAARLELWDTLKFATEGDANPFQDDEHAPGLFVVHNAIWLGICGLAYYCSPANDPAFRGVRVIMALAILSWLGGGLYISHAPDFLKLPLLIGTVPTRALGWPQNLAYVALLAVILERVQSDPRLRTVVLAGLGAAALFIVGPGNIDRWLVLCGVATGGVLLFHAGGRPRWLSGRAADTAYADHVAASGVLILAQILGLVAILAFAVAAWQKAPLWAFALRTGVYGDTTSAAWVGVDTYIRENTPASASVLPITYRTRPTYLAGEGQGRDLWASRSLGTRAGRAMPVPEHFPADFRNPDAWKMADAQKALVDGVVAALQARDFARARAAIDRLKPIPDFIVLPSRVLAGSGEALAPYAVTAQVRGYTVLRRTAEKNPQ